MTDMIEEWRTSDMTATLTHLAGVLGSLPLDGYREALAAQVAESASWAAEGLPSSEQHRRARRAALLAAVCAARDFVTAMQDAMSHNRAAARATEAEATIREVPPPSWMPPPPPRPSGSALHDTFPGARVIPLRREESVTDEPA